MITDLLFLVLFGYLTAAANCVRYALLVCAVTKIALCFPGLFVCLSVCILSCALSYAIVYTTMLL